MPVVASKATKISCLPVVEALQGVDVLTGPQLILKAVEVSSRLPQLKLMQITSAGYDEFNNGGPEVLDGLRRNGIMFANNGGGILERDRCILVHSMHDLLAKTVFCVHEPCETLLTC